MARRPIDEKPRPEWLRRLTAPPRPDAPRSHRALRYIIDLGIVGARQLRRDRAPQMAAALAFRTLFGLIPVFVVGTILVKAFRGLDEFRERLTSIFAALGLDEIEITTADGLTGTLSDWLVDIIGQVETLNLAAVGWIGVVIIGYSAISLMVTIENSFNGICGAPAGRSWVWRIVLYWFVITLSPLAIIGTFYADGWVAGVINSAGPTGWLATVAETGWSFLITWILMFLIYKLVPNAHVAGRSLFVGAFVGAVLVEIGRRTMGVYLENAVSLRQLYGSLGFIPLAMFWIYLFWLVILFGLELAVTLHRLRGRRIEELTPTTPESRDIVEPAVVIDVAVAIAEAFDAGRRITIGRLAGATNLHETTVHEIINAMRDAGLVHPIDGEDDESAVAPTSPPDRLALPPLLELGFALTETPVGTAGGRSRLRSAQLAAVKSLTVSDLRVERATVEGDASD
ncbi:MAG: YihY/virulence factor BrkB family protein [Phycisphaerales bacterium]|nr:YihY/virulence factor BrkB family protein [Phycisphaerales bacterium]